MYLQKKILYKFLFVLINALTNLLCVCVCVCVFNALEEDSSEQEKCILSRLQKYLSVQFLYGNHVQVACLMKSVQV